MGKIIPAIIATIMSFNIRYDNPNDGVNTWELRKDEVVGLIEYYHPDFLGMQEGLHHQVRYIEENTSNYAYIGVGRDDGRTKGEYANIFYDTSKYQLLEDNTFWLSETPDKISKGWDANIVRIYTYGKFKHKNSSKEIYVFNAHFDHKGNLSREKSAELIVQKIKALGIENQPLIVMGDFNCLPESAPIKTFKTLLEDGKENASKPFYGPEGTFNSFDPNRILENRIDYIFSKNLNVLSYRHIDDRRQNNLCVSDHLPILIYAEN